MAYVYPPVDPVNFALVEGHRRAKKLESWNDALGDILFAETPEAAPKDDAPIAGALAPLMMAGLVRAGDTLRHIRRTGVEHEALVTQSGHVQTADGRLFRQPSPALKALLGHEVNGWKAWTVVRTGSTLAELRARLPRSERS